MNKTFKLLFFLRKPAPYSGGEIPIYLRITVDYDRVEMNTQRKCDPEKWNNISGRANGTKEVTRQLNCYLDTLQGKAFEIQRDLIHRNLDVTAKKIRDVLQGRDEQTHTLVSVYQEHIEQIKALVGKDYAVGTLKRFKAAFNSLDAFLISKNKTDVRLTDLNYHFITEYEFFLKSVRGIEHNTAMGIIKKLKKIVRICVANDWIQKDPFMNYKVKIKDTNRPFLLQEELDRIIQKQFVTDRLPRVRDIFVFSCYTGLSYTDVQLLSHKNIVTIEGRKWIHTKRQKTDVPTRIPLLPEALKIIDRYKDQPDTQDRLLPVLSNQKMNEYLKDIAERCEITKALTFHVARHTFATTITLTNGVPIETVSKMLGHRSIRTTQQYAKVIDSKVGSDMLQLERRIVQ